MSKRLIVGVLLLVVIGIGGYILTTRSDDNNQGDGAANSSQATTDAQDSTTGNLEGLDSEFKNPFNVDVTALQSNLRIDFEGSKVAGYIEIDKDENLHLLLDSDGEIGEYVQVNDTAYAKDSGSNRWFEIDLEINSLVADLTTGYELDSEAYTSTNVSQSETVSCSIGTCRKYTVSETEDVAAAELLVAADTNRPHKWQVIDSSVETITFTYVYDDVAAITVPGNVQEFGL